MTTDPQPLADALLDGPWRIEPMRIRLTRAFELILVPRTVDRLMADLLHAHPEPPEAADLTGWLEASGITEWADEPFGGASIGSTLPDLASLARLLDVDDGELAWFADSQSWERRCSEPLRHYRWRTIPRRRGVRLLAAPKPRLKEIQRRLLRHVVGLIPLHEAAHGCVAGRSVRTAVEPHVQSTVVVRADLESFFASITAGRVFGVLRIAGLSEPVAHCVAALCTTVAPLSVWRAVPRPQDPARIDSHVRLGERLRTPHLPQGAPTSPALANAVAYDLDRRLTGLAAAFGARYTRYVDDLTFSGSHRLRHGLLAALGPVVASSGFRLAEAKSVLLTDGGRQQVLGAVINDHPTLPRPDRDNLRALLHNCDVLGWASQARGRGRDEFRDHLRGRVAHLAGIDAHAGDRMRIMFERIAWD